MCLISPHCGCDARTEFARHCVAYVVDARWFTTRAIREIDTKGAILQEEATTMNNAINPTSNTVRHRVVRTLHRAVRRQPCPQTIADI